jgi:hypothetical protein
MGYPIVRLQVEGKGVRYLVHRLVCIAFHGGSPPGQPLVDHRDMNSQNCSKDNLRWASQSQNRANQLGSKTRSSRFKGVVRRRSGFAAYAANGVRTLYLGTFATEEEAAIAYDRDATVRFGDFARPNFPQKGDELPPLMREAAK